MVADLGPKLASGEPSDKPEDSAKITTRVALRYSCYNSAPYRGGGKHGYVQEHARYVVRQVC
jgi:hypothetical protein